MLIPNQMIENTWTQNNKELYISLGYKFTKYKDKFEIKAEHLSKGSNRRVLVQCDFCGCIVNKKYQTYIMQHHEKYGDCCAKCQPQKNKLICMDKYGVDNGSKTPEAIEKIKNTCLEKYGVDNGAKTLESRQKISEKVKKSYNNIDSVNKRIDTNRERYGCDYPCQNEQVKEKQKQTMLDNYGVTHPKKSEEIKEKERIHNREKYGCDYYLQTDECKERVKKTNLEKYGVEYTLQSPEIRRKGMQTLLANGNCPTSKQQLKLYELLKEIYEVCELNKPCGSKFLDCAICIDGQWIDIEYDGRYWHQDKERDRKRDEFCKSQGYKILRIDAEVSIPTKEQVIEKVEYLLNSEEDIAKIILDI